MGEIQYLRGNTSCLLYSPGSPATISAVGGLRSVALRPTLSDGLPFTGLSCGSLAPVFQVSTAFIVDQLFYGANAVPEAVPKGD